MEKNVTLSASSQTEVNFQSVANSLQTAVAKMAQKVMAPLEWLRSYYSNICEKQLTMGQTGTLVSAQLAFIATALPAAFAIALRKLSRPDWASNTTILRR